MVKTQGAADTREGGPVDGVDDSSSGYRFQVPFSFWSPCYIVRAQGAHRAGQPALHVTCESRRDIIAWGSKGQRPKIQNGRLTGGFYGAGNNG